ncbi:MAG: alpha/beta fold hydrolase, partial [Jiangellaceae bacterium]
FRVIAYERRGFARSPLDGEPAADRLATDVDDLRLLLDRLSAAPAHILGSSSGAIVALSFLAEHPGHVATLLAHEPPYVSALPDARQRLTDLDQAYAVYRSDGLEAGMRSFAEHAGLGRLGGPAETGELPEHMREMFGRIRSNMEFWFEHELRQYVRAVPDLETLAGYRGRITLGCGTDSTGTLAHRPNLLLAERLGLTPVLFPGGHAGFAEHPKEFAETLTPLLGG